VPPVDKVNASRELILAISAERSLIIFVIFFLISHKNNHMAMIPMNTENFFGQYHWGNKKKRGRKSQKWHFFQNIDKSETGHDKIINVQ